MASKMSLYQINVIPREEWGAKKPKLVIPEFTHPGMHVILTLKSDFSECTTKEDCMEKVRLMQKQHMEEWGLPDIAYNFIMGNDGNIYEGRGWNVKAAKAIGNPLFNGKTYDIGLIGDYSEEIPDTMYFRSMALLKYAVQFEYLHGDYTYVGHIDGEEEEEFDRSKYILEFE